MLPQAIQPYFRLAEHCVNPDVLLQPTLDAILKTIKPTLAGNSGICSLKGAREDQVKKVIYASCELDVAVCLFTRVSMTLSID